MNKKSIFTWFIWIIIFSLVFGYSLVFAGTGLFDDSIKLYFKSSDNLYLDSLTLNSTRVVFKSSWHDLSNYEIKSECDIYSKMVYKKDDLYMFDLKLFWDKCDNNNFILVDDKDEIVSRFSFNLIKEYDLLSNLLDLSTPELFNLKNALDSKYDSYLQYKDYDKQRDLDFYVFLKNNRIYNEAYYNKHILDNIIEKRNEKYIVPVAWRQIPTIDIRLPNTRRPYRKEYTDWIHHWWDIYWNFWEQVIALDDWIIVRTVDKFEFSDLDKIKRWDNLTKEDELRNLDLLRWKQVWLKTMKWDVVFYSHLNDIFSNVKVWEVVKSWQPLWTIWITWVPDQEYKDYHLHFEVQKNPFTLKTWESYDYDDYLNWDWLMDWESIEYVKDHQLEYFKS